MTTTRRHGNDDQTPRPEPTRLPEATAGTAALLGAVQTSFRLARSRKARVLK
jgi:hypothetical protein